MFGFLFAATYILGAVLMYEFLGVLEEIEFANSEEPHYDDAVKISNIIQSAIWPYYVIKATVLNLKGA